MIKVFVLIIRGYQVATSSVVPRCKYYPSCSTYAADAVTEYGAKGLAMAAWRLVRCNPWSHGGVDYVLSKSSNQPIKRATKIMNGTN
jgi:putative membrane protein insertion efficiency factor